MHNQWECEMATIKKKKANSMTVPQRIKIDLSYDPAISLLGM